MEFVRLRTAAQLVTFTKPAPVIANSAQISVPSVVALLSVLPAKQVSSRTVACAHNALQAVSLAHQRPNAPSALHLDSISQTGFARLAVKGAKFVLQLAA